MRGSPVFKEENALPRSKLHFSIDNRNCLAGARQDHADVRWHIIAAFGAVCEIIGIFRHESVEEFFQIAPRSGISILHDHNAATGVLNKDRDHSATHAALLDL